MQHAKHVTFQTPVYYFMYIYHRSPVGVAARGKFLSKLWPVKKNTTTPLGIKASQSWDSSYATAAAHILASQNTLHVVDDVEENLPTPPLLPTLGYLLGKRPPNLRGRGQSSRSISGAVSRGDDDECISDIDSDNSSVSSTQSSIKSQHKKRTKKKKRGPKEDDAFDWQYNKLTVPQSSPPRERKGIARKLTPRPTELTFRAQSNGFEISHKLEIGAMSDSPSSFSFPSPKSPVASPSHVSPSPSFTGDLNKHNGSLQPKQQFPLSQQNSQTMVESKLPDPLSKKATPISLKDSSRKQMQRQQPETNGNQHTTEPYMADLNQAVKTSSTPPRIMRQLASPTGHYPSPTTSIGQVCIIKTCSRY